MNIAANEAMIRKMKAEYLNKPTREPVRKATVEKRSLLGRLAALMLDVIMWIGIAIAAVFAFFYGLIWLIVKSIPLIAGIIAEREATQWYYGTGKYAERD